MASFADEAQQVQYYAESGQVEVALTGDGTTVDTPFTLASVGKAMTAVAVLRLVDRDLVDLDAPVARYVSEALGDGFGGLTDVTVRHLLTMTSGLPDYYTNDYIGDALADPDEVQHAEVALTYVFDEDRLFRPGTQFDYANTNYVLLGIVLETVTGQTYADVLRDEVFAHSGMSDSFVFGSQALPATFPKGHEGRQHFRYYYENNGFGDGGVVSTAPDLARFYQAVFEDRVLLTDDMMDVFLTDPKDVGYGMGIEVDGDIVGHSGGDLGFATDVRMDRETGAIAIVLSADGDADTSWAQGRIEDR